MPAYEISAKLKGVVLARARFHTSDEAVKEMGTILNLGCWSQVLQVEIQHIEPNVDRMGEISGADKERIAGTLPGVGL